MLATILAAIEAGGTLIPEVATLINEVKGTLGTDDQATIDAALAASTARAAAQHDEAQNL